MNIDFLFKKQLSLRGGLKQMTWLIGFYLILFSLISFGFSFYDYLQTSHSVTAYPVMMLFVKEFKLLILFLLTKKWVTHCYLNGFVEGYLEEKQLTIRGFCLQTGIPRSYVRVKNGHLKLYKWAIQTFVTYFDEHEIKSFESAEVESPAKTVLSILGIIIVFTLGMLALHVLPELFAVC